MNCHSRRRLQLLQLVAKAEGVALAGVLPGGAGHRGVGLDNLLALHLEIVLDDALQVVHVVTDDPRRRPEGRGVLHHPAAPLLFGDLDQGEFKQPYPVLFNSGLIGF